MNIEHVSILVSSVLPTYETTANPWTYLTNINDQAQTCKFTAFSNASGQRQANKHYYLCVTERCANVTELNVEHIKG